MKVVSFGEKLLPWLNIFLNNNFVNSTEGLFVFKRQWDNGAMGHIFKRKHHQDYCIDKVSPWWADHSTLIDQKLFQILIPTMLAILDDDDNQNK